MVELAILTFIIKFSFIVCSIIFMSWVYKAGKWVCRKVRLCDNQPWPTWSDVNEVMKERRDGK